MSAWFKKIFSDTPKEFVKNAYNLRPQKGVISSLLSEETLIIAPQGLDKKGLIEAMVLRLCEKKGLSDFPGLLAKVLEREQGISTTLDTGLSLPHARIGGLKAIVAGLAVVPQGIVDPKHPDLVIRLMFLFFSPSSPEAFATHLKLLRGASSLFRTPLIDKLSRATSPAAALEFICSQEA
jgi:PTS system nitrogen regulatory IIA component